MLLGYNSQIAVDDTFKFIVATDISTNGHDLDQLYNMAIKSKEIVDNKNMIVTADKGYYSSVEIKKFYVLSRLAVSTIKKYCRKKENSELKIF